MKNKSLNALTAAMLLCAMPMMASKPAASGKYSFGWDTAHKIVTAGVLIGATCYAGNYAWNQYRKGETETKPSMCHLHPAVSRMGANQKQVMDVVFGPRGTLLEPTAGALVLNKEFASTLAELQDAARADVKVLEESRKDKKTNAEVAVTAAAPAVAAAAASAPLRLSTGSLSVPSPRGKSGQSALLTQQ